MPSKTQKELKQMLQPFVFVLKEGSEIKEDLLDYALMMLHVHCLEVIKKPKKTARKITLPSKAASNVLPRPAAEKPVSRAKI
ncbi:MAG: hypothetical protein Q8K75_07960 [Chlamydiales bacterium]|nr:hypothetical protein [Chlamydiales bacterium]